MDYLIGIAFFAFVDMCIYILAPISTVILSVLECENWIIRILYFVWIIAEFIVLTEIKDTKK